MSKTKKISLTAIGTALFVVLSMCIQIPVFENYYLCFGYMAVAVFCYSFGTLSGTLIGFLGVIIYCLIINGMRGMPGWALGNIVIGIALGLCFSKTKSLDSKILKTAINVAVIIISTVIGILIVKSLAECLLYSQPMAVRMGKNVFAAVADVIVLVISLPICSLVDKAAYKIVNQSK